MAIEFFTQTFRGTTPKASIRKQGQIGLNSAAVRKYNIKDGEYILLGYDRDRKTVVIKRISKPQHGCRRVMVKGKMCAVSAKSFLNYFGIEYSKTSSSELTQDKKGLLVFPVGGKG